MQEKPQKDLILKNDIITYPLIVKDSEDLYITDDTELAMPFAMILVFPEPEAPWTARGYEESLAK